jgi:PAS domain S-box-containing protein
MDSNKYISKLMATKAWKLLFSVVLLSELFTFIINILNSYIWWGKLNLDLLLIGSIDALIVSLIVGGMVILLLNLMRVNESKLKQSEAKFRYLYESTTDGIFILDLDGNFIDVNTTAHTRLGFTKDEMLALHISQLDPPEFAAKVPERLALIQEKGSAVFESAHLRKDGTSMPVEVNARLIQYEGRQVYFSNIRDITERKNVEKRLTRAQSIAHVGDWQWDVPSGEIQWSDELFRIYGYEPDEIPPDYGLVLEKLHPDSKEAFLKAIDLALTQDRPFDMDYGFFRKDGSEAVLHTVGTVYRDKSGSAVQMVGIVEDITQRKRAEDELKKAHDELEIGVEERTWELKAMNEKLQMEIIERTRAEKTIEVSLREKEILLKEIHHRVKNNMAIISSLLSLQEDRTEHKGSKEILIDFQNRIRTMALVHEKLLSSDDFGSIQLKEYIESLTKNIVSSFSDSIKHIECILQIEQVSLDMDKLIPFGLILNETITNAIKHAFMEVEHPVISLIVTKNGKDFTLSIEDNGNGIPEKIDILKSQSLGGKIINTLVKQLKGTIQVSSNTKGTNIKITCPI